MTDAQRHFTQLVPQEVFNFPPLLYAVLAFSAYQLRHKDAACEKASELYYSKCVADLIPVLEYADAAADGRVLAATVILRMYEMQYHCKLICVL